MKNNVKILLSILIMSAVKRISAADVDDHAVLINKGDKIESFVLDRGFYDDFIALNHLSHADLAQWLNYKIEEDLRRYNAALGAENEVNTSQAMQEKNEATSVPFHFKPIIGNGYHTNEDYEREDRRESSLEKIMVDAAFRHCEKKHRRGSDCFYQCVERFLNL